MAAAAGFGLIGALAEAAVEARRVSELRATLEAERYDPAARWRSALRQSLERAGFTVVEVPAMRRQSDWVEPLPPAAVDAYLDVVLESYGFATESLLSPLSPYATARLRLLDPRGVTIWQDTLTLNSAAFHARVVRLDGSDAYRFPSAAGSFGDAPRVIASVDAAFFAVAGAIGEGLR